MTRFLLVLCLLWSATIARSDEPLVIGSRRELFVDDQLIESLRDARRQLHHPTPREIAIVHDAPWEGAGSGYHSVIRDGDLYRMYYRGSALGVANGKLKSGPEVYCYAESRDGITFTKPELGLHEHEGSKQNNIIWTGVGTHNFAPFLDTRADCPAESRFKALGGLPSQGGLFAFHSADGIRWSLMHEKPVVTEGAFDSQNLAFWDATAGVYRAYFRTFTGGVTTGKVWKPEGYRAIRTATSRDFQTWENQADLTYKDSPAEHLYTNQVAPYFRAPHILIGFPARYVERGWSDSMRALPELELREQRSAAHLRYGTALTEGLLMASRNGVHFERWNEAFLRPGPERPKTWLYGHQFIAWHAVETKSSLPDAPNELSLYASEGSWHGKGNSIRRYTLRLDGFVSVNAPLSGGEFLTKPLTFAGDKLTLNFATSAAGDIRVEIQNADGTPIPDFTLDDCPPVFGDTIERMVTWKGGSDVSKLAGKPVRLRFVLRDADLYSFRFTPIRSANARSSHVLERSVGGAAVGSRGAKFGVRGVSARNSTLLANSATFNMAMKIARRPKMQNRYSIAEARDQLTRILRSVEQGAAVELTRRGQPVAVLVSAKDFSRLQHGKTSFWEAYSEFIKRPENRKGLLSPDEFQKLRDRSPGRKVKL